MEPTLRQEMQTYRQSIIDDYRKSYGEFNGRHWKYTIPLTIDRTNLELKYLWENPNGI